MKEYHNLGEVDFISFLYGNKNQEFIWKKHKFCMTFDSASLPQGTPSAVIKLYATLGEHCILPTHLKPVSTFFAIKTDCKFKKSVSVSIEHCSVNTKYLKFAICSSLSPPYVFEEVDSGSFTEGCGVINRTSFSICVIVWDTLRNWFWPSPVSIRFYIAMYTKMRESYTWDVYVYITKHTETYVEKVKENAEKNGRSYNTHSVVTLPGNVHNFEMNTSFEQNGWHALSDKGKIMIPKSRIENLTEMITPAIFKVGLKKTKDKNQPNLNHDFKVEKVEQQDNNLTFTLAVKGKYYVVLYYTFS